SYAQRAKRMAQRRPLRHGGHGHFAEWNADDRSQHQRDDDPFVLHDAGVQQSPRNRQQHTQLTGENSAPRRLRRAQPLQRQNEKRCGNQVSNFDDLIPAGEIDHGFLGPLALNMRSMRSVIRKPPTMLLVAATIAIVPSIFASVAPWAWN